MKTTVMVLPSLRISGGVLEALRFANDLGDHQGDVQVMSMWEASNPVEASQPVFRLSRWHPNFRWAALQLPWLALRFLVVTTIRRARSMPTHYVFTHYSTLPLAWLVPRAQRWLLVQDLEWMFLRPGRARRILMRLVMATASRSRLIVVNDYLHRTLNDLGLPIDLEYPIWADHRFLNSNPAPRVARPVDVLFVLRKGHAKRAAMYFDVARELHGKDPDLRFKAVTPDDDLHRAAVAAGFDTLLRPTREQLHDAYGSSKCCLLLSDHEGFGLPPLESMGSGCVPVCRDSGGPSAYMTGALSSLLLSHELEPPAIAAAILHLLSDEEQWKRLSRAAIKIFADNVGSMSDRRRLTVQAFSAAPGS